MGKATARRTIGTSPRNGNSYRHTVRALSDRLVQAQRPIRVLDAVKWGEEIEQAFFAFGGRELPPVTLDYYRTHSLRFDPDTKIEELNGIARDVIRRLGEHDAVGQILAQMCREYRAVVWMLARRGTPDFGKMSEQLYGSAGDCILPELPCLVEVGRRMAVLLDGLTFDDSLGGKARYLGAPRAAYLLTSRLNRYFQDPSAVRVRISDGIVADAAAGCDYIKIRSAARFTAQDLRLLEVHEGWVHLATTINGQRQPFCTFLGKGTPSSTVTQEGLAVLTELLASASYPQRLRRLSHRVEAIARAEAGADFLEVYRFFQDTGYAPRASYQHTVRVFRGSLPSGCGPFTKDLCYAKGFAQVCEHVRRAVECADSAQVTHLFCGKTTLADLPVLTQMVADGLVVPPRHLPPPFADLRRLAARMHFLPDLRTAANRSGESTTLSGRRSSGS
jgi:uncharacterized protein (TIGR02421 family)